jgi:hypothetical protein
LQRVVAPFVGRLCAERLCTTITLLQTFDLSSGVGSIQGCISLLLPTPPAKIHAATFDSPPLVVTWPIASHALGHAQPTSCVSTCVPCLPSCLPSLPSLPACPHHERLGSDTSSRHSSPHRRSGWVDGDFARRKHCDGQLLLPELARGSTNTKHQRAHVHTRTRTRTHTHTLLTGSRLFLDVCARAGWQATQHDHAFASAVQTGRPVSRLCHFARFAHTPPVPKPPLEWQSSGDLEGKADVAGTVHQMLQDVAKVLARGDTPETFRRLTGARARTHTRTHTHTHTHTTSHFLPRATPMRAVSFNDSNFVATISKDQIHVRKYTA